jgi:5'-nucleotidase
MLGKRPAAAFALLTAFIATGKLNSPAQSPRPVTVQILAINDLHGNLEPPVGSDGVINGIPAGGVEYLATHLRNAERENPNSILVGAGDIFGGSPLLSALFEEKPTIEAVNAMHLAVSSIGNHELDHGVAALREKVKGTCTQNPGQPGACPDAAHFQYLAANAEETQTPGKTIFPATAIRTVGGVRIGFIGETLQNTAAMISAGYAKGLRFLEESAAANAAAAELDRQGVHAIVLLIHQGGFQNPGSGADPNGCRDLSGPIAGIVEKLSPSIQVVISGHTHVFYNCQIGGHTLTSASAYGRMFTRISLTIDPRSDTILHVEAKNEVVTRDVAKDPAQTAILDRFRPQAARITNRVVGSIAGDFPRTENSAGESPMVDLVADAQLASVSAPGKGGAVVGFMNVSGVRAVLIRPPGSTGPQPVTYGELYAALPFGNRVTVLTLTGDQIRRMLEQQFHSTGNTEYLKPSEGFAYSFRANAPPGEHIVPGSITLHGRPVAPTDILRVETNDFLADGGGGFTVFLEGKDRVDGPVEVDALVQYFAAHSPVTPNLTSRVTRVD